MKILMIILLCLCLLLQIGCMGNPDTKESHQSGAETTLTEKKYDGYRKRFGNHKKPFRSRQQCSDKHDERRAD